MACGVLTDAGTPYIYCVGGRAVTIPTIIADRVFRYNPVTDMISPVAAPWPAVMGNGSARWLHSLQQQALYPGRIRHHHERRARDKPDLGVYSVPAAWVQKTTVLPVPLGYIPTTTIGSLIYTGGGSDITAGALTDTTNSFVYNPVANTIGTIAAIPRVTGETRALNFNGLMLVMGGGRTAPNPSNEVDAYDPVANSWTVNSPVPAFVNARRNFPTDTDGTTRIWLTGGYDSDWYTHSVDRAVLPGGGTPTPTPTATATATQPQLRRQQRQRLNATATATATTATASPTATGTATASPTATATATGSPTATPPPGIRATPTPRPRPTPAPRP